MLIDISRESGVRDAVAALREAGTGLQLQLMDDARRELESAWVAALTARATDSLDQSVIVSGSRASVGADGFLMLAAQDSRPLSMGLVPSAKWFAVEMGARTRKAAVQTHSRKGKPYIVRKMLNRGLPSRQRYGRVAFDAASEVGTDLVRLWIKVTVKRYRAAVGDESDD